MKSVFMNDKQRYKCILGHYNDLCLEAEEYRSETLTKDKASILKKAIQMDLFQIGEHINRLSDDIKKKINTDDLRGVIGTRNVIAHGYQQIDMDIIWDSIDYECPKLLKQLEELFK